MSETLHKPATPDEIAAMARNAGLTLSAAHLAELVDAYSYIEKMVARVHQDRAFADEPAHVFVPQKFEPTSEH